MKNSQVQRLSIKKQNAHYPSLLKQIYKPPETLYCKGNINILKKTCISIVGTRKYTEYGEIITKKIVEDLAILDMAIVSGLAKGIDTIAHESALEYGLPTIAVLGSGIDNIYPKFNLKLAEKITQKGLIISEFPGNREPTKQSFPMRNRIVSGISIATVVVEAPERSGALITARLSLDQGREIFAVPGDADRETSVGPLRLLQRGAAYPISSGRDIIEVLKKQPKLFDIPENKNSKQNAPDKKFTQSHSKNKKTAIPYNLPPDQQEILSILSTRQFRTFEQISQRTNNGIPDTLSILSILEIQGLIEIKNGKYLRKC